MTLHLDTMPPETGRLFADLVLDPDISKFTLIGGTALALSFAHRRSEDLDFAFVGAGLPRKACVAIVTRLEALGWEFLDITKPEEGVDDGDPLDSPQNWQATHPDGGEAVKLTFVTEFFPHSVAPYRQFQPLEQGTIRIMPPEGIFILKSQLLTVRVRVRDLFDIMTFLENGRTMEEVFSEFRKANRHMTYDGFRRRVLEDKPPITDSGFARLVDDGPTTLDEIRTVLGFRMDELDKAMAAKVIDEQPGDPIWKLP